MVIMGKTSKSKAYLIEAIKSLPNDFALSEARFYLNTALQEISKVEKKRAKRENKQIKSIPNMALHAKQAVLANQPEAKQWTPEQLMNVLNVIDGMIKEEQKKIEKKETNGKMTNINTLLG